MKMKKIKVRHGWEINPRSRIKESKKKYDRNKLKEELYDMYEEEETDVDVRLY
jgi:hypothetical protein